MTQTQISFSARTKHSLTFYHSCLQGLLHGVNAQMSNVAIANHLNQENIPAPTGSTWTTKAVSQALYKLRNFRAVSSNLHVAMNQLILDGVMTMAQCLPLLESKAPDRL